jgi:integrase
MSKGRKPRAIDLDSVHVRPIRPPSKRCPEWYWRAVCYVSGKEETVWTGRATREEAKRIVNARMASGELFADRGGQEQEEITTLKDLLECWLGAQEQRADIAANTFPAYKKSAERLEKAIGAVLITGLHRGSLERYRDQRLREGAAPSTVGHELQVLRSAWRWGQDLGACPHHRLPSVRLPKERRYNHRTPTRGDVAKVLEELDGWQRLAVLLLYATGARPGEVTHLTWDDLDLERGLVHLGRHDGARKTGERTVPLSASVLEELEAWGQGERQGYVLRDEPDTARSVLGYYVKQACKRAGIEHWTPMGLRRLAEDELYRRVGDPSAAALFLGHSPEMAMRHYRRATVTDLREAMRAAELGKVPAGEVIDLKARTKTAHTSG